MNAFKVTVTVSEGELGKVLSSFSRKQIAEAEIVPIGQYTPGWTKPSGLSGKLSSRPIKPIKPTGRKAGVTIVMKGDRGTSGLAERQHLLGIMGVHERLEKKLGIGSVSRNDLTKAARLKFKNNFKNSHISALIDGGWLTYVQPEEKE